MEFFHICRHTRGDVTGRPVQYETGLGGFTVAISPSLILGALFRRTTRVATLASMIGPIAVYVYLLTIGGMHPFPAIGCGLIVSLGLHLLVNPFTKPEPEEHLNRIFGRR
jgi:Na+/proline symporter